MLLAGGIVGVAAPLLLEGAPLQQAELIRVASGVLLFTVVVGAIFEAIEEKRTTPLLVAAGKANRQAAALALAEDAKLISAVSGNPDPAADQVVHEAEKELKAAEKPFRDAAEFLANVSLFESVLFYGAFVVGVLLLMLAAGGAV